MGAGRGSLVSQRGGAGHWAVGRVSLLQAVVWGVGQWLGSGATMPPFPREAGLAWAGRGRGGGFFLGWGLGMQKVGRAWGRHHLHGLQGSDMGRGLLA